MTAALTLTQAAAGDGRSALSVRPLQKWNFRPCPPTYATTCTALTLTGPKESCSPCLTAAALQLSSTSRTCFCNPSVDPELDAISFRGRSHPYCFDNLARKKSCSWSSRPHHEGGLHARSGRPCQHLRFHRHSRADSSQQRFASC